MLLQICNKRSSEKTVASKSCSYTTRIKIAIASSALNNINYYLFDVTSRLRSILNAQPLQNTGGGVAFFQLKKKLYSA